MKTCPRMPQLESVASGEAPVALAVELRAHAEGCAVCRHELAWLQTEAELFRMRAARDEVGLLWSRVAERCDPPRRRPWSRGLLVAAASLLVLLGLGRLSLEGLGPKAAADDEAQMSDALMSPMLGVGDDDNCSKLPDGVGFRCESPVPASVLASR